MLQNRERQPRQRLDDQRKAPGQVIARAAVELDPVASLAGDDSDGVVVGRIMNSRETSRRILAVDPDLRLPSGP